MADLNYCPACQLPADSFQHCGSPNCAVRDYGPGDACARRRAAPATAGMAGQDQRALELAHGALIAAQPRDAQPAGWERHEKAINAVAAALHKPSAAGMVGQDAKDAARYRWLKGHWGKRTPILNGIKPVGAVDAAFDAGIDHAIALAAQQAQASAKGEQA